MASHLPFEILTHKQKVCSLYKRAVRCLQDWHHVRHNFRYQATLMRARFEENRHCTDPAVIRDLLEDGEEELFNKKHCQPIKFWHSIGGLCYDREQHIPDSVLDDWHPLQKAQYPKYFATREKRKEEFIKMWEEEYGKPDVCKKGH